MSQHISKWKLIRILLHKLTKRLAPDRSLVTLIFNYLHSNASQYKKSYEFTNVVWLLNVWIKDWPKFAFDFLPLRKRIVDAKKGDVHPYFLTCRIGRSSGSLTIPRCNTGTRSWHGQSLLSLRIHYAQVTECRQWRIHPGFKTHEWSQLRSKTKSISGSTIWWHCHHKKIWKTKHKNM